MIYDKMTAEYPDLSFRLKRMRFSSRIIPFVLHTNEKESLLASVVNVLFLRRKIQLPKEITTLTFDDICRLITPVCKHEDPELVSSHMPVLAIFADTLHSWSDVHGLWHQVPTRFPSCGVR